MDIDLDSIFNKIEKDKSEQIDANSKVLIIDGLNTYLRAFSCNNAMNDDGVHIGGITGFFNSICLAIRQMSPTRCIVIFDGKGGSLRRRKIYEGYKEKRRGLRVRLNRQYEFEDVDDEHKNAMKQLLRIADYLDCLPVTMMIQDNVEADDIIAYLAKEIFDKKVIIMSTDSDFMQLVDDRISIWYPPRKKLYDPKLVKTDYEFTPNNHVYLKMINGDDSDDIPGIKGIGIKTIQKNFPLICDDVDISWEEFKDYLNKSIDNKTAKKLVENMDILERNYKLIKLGEVEIGGETKSKIREQINSSISTINNFKFKSLFLEDKLYSNIPNLDSWLKLHFSKLNGFALTHNNGGR